jgi:hypothetical protein
MQIVLAWMSHEPEMIDPGIPDSACPRSPKFRQKPVACTCIWLANGNSSDIAKARVYAGTMDPPAKVFTYGPNEDALKQAKLDIAQYGTAEIVSARTLKRRKGD